MVVTRTGTLKFFSVILKILCQLRLGPFAKFCSQVMASVLKPLRRRMVQIRLVADDVNSRSEVRMQSCGLQRIDRSPADWL